MGTHGRTRRKTRVLLPKLAGQVREDSRTDRALITRRTTRGSTRILLEVLMSAKKNKNRTKSRRKIQNGSVLVDRPRRTEKRRQAASDKGWITRPTLPNDERPPTERLQFDHSSTVARFIARKLLHPKFHVRRRRRASLATVVTMPKTTVHEDNRSSCGKNDVRPARQVSSVDSESVAGAMCGASDRHLGSGARLADAAHVPRSLFLAQGVHNGRKSRTAVTRLQPRDFNAEQRRRPRRSEPWSSLVARATGRELTAKLRSALARAILPPRGILSFGGERLREEDGSRRLWLASDRPAIW